MVPEVKPTFFLGRFTKMRDVYQSMEMPWKDYILKLVVFPTLSATICVMFILLYFQDLFNDIYLRSLLLLLPFYFFMGLIFKPVIDNDRRKHKINQEIHLFITRIGVLSISNISKKGMFSVLSEMKEYGELAKEITKVFNLADKWGISLAEACRLVAKTTPSVIFSDFLNRLAHALESGESVGTFFKNEQKVILDEYQVSYERGLYAIEVMKEMFVATVISATFMLVIIMMYPMLTGEDASSLLALSIFLFAFVEFVFFFFLSSVIPDEYIWQSSDIRTDVDIRIQRYLLIAGLISAFLASIFLVLQPEISVFFMLAITFTPLSVPSIYIYREENLIKRREENFSAFIRSVGTSSDSGTLSMTTTLSRLKEHDFGPLTKNIVDLNKRLALHLDTRKSWKYFGAETGSDLALKFSEMFLEGSLSGGNTKEMSQIISDNFNRIRGLRMRRYASASTMIGFLYGIAVFVALALFLSLGIIYEISDIYATVEVPAGYEDVEILQPDSFEGWVLTLAIVAIILIHAIISSLMSRIAGGGHKAGALLHITNLLWIGFIMEIIAGLLLDMVIG